MLYIHLLFLLQLLLNFFYLLLQEYKNALEIQALQEDKAQEQLQIDNQYLLQKIQVSDINLSVLKLKPSQNVLVGKMAGVLGRS